MREVFVEIAEVHWDDVGGLEEAKQSLIESVEWPLKYPEAFQFVAFDHPVASCSTGCLEPAKHCS